MTERQQSDPSRATAPKRGFNWSLALIVFSVLLVGFGAGFGTAWFLPNTATASKDTDKDKKDVDEGETDASKDKAELKNQTDTLSYAYGLASSMPKDQLNEVFKQIDADAEAPESYDEGIADALSIKFDAKKRTYYFGYLQGLQMALGNIPSIEKTAFMGDSKKHLNLKLVSLGMRDGHNGKSVLRAKLDSDNIQETRLITAGQDASMFFQQYLYGTMLKKANEDYMANVAKRPDVKPLDGGVYYKVIKAGNGPVPTANSEVQVEYEGKLTDGTIFDSSKGQAITFPVNAVIPGWITALTHMPQGSEWEVYIPSQQAYGERGTQGIPPHADLIFKIKLIEVN